MPTVFVTGEVSCFYDSNALWNAVIPNNFKVIVVNNEGGGIFRILSDKKDSELFDTYFETKHQLTAKPLAEMYGFSYMTIQEESELEAKIQEFFAFSEGPAILEIFTPSTINDKVLMDYFKFI